MTRTRRALISIGVFVLSIIVGLILNNVGLGLLIGLIIGFILFIALQSTRGNNRGVMDEDHGIEL